MNARFAAMLLAGMLACSLAGCDRNPFGYVDLADVTAHADRYDGQEIKVRGEVADNLKVLSLRSYTLKQGPATLAVFTKGDVPAVGDRIAIRARLTSFAVVSGEAVGARLEEIERLKPLW